jgi:hypothetical protein
VAPDVGCFQAMMEHMLEVAIGVERMRAGSSFASRWIGAGFRWDHRDPETLGIVIRSFHMSSPKFEVLTFDTMPARTVAEMAHAVEAGR